MHHIHMLHFMYFYDRDYQLSRAINTGLLGRIHHYKSALQNFVRDNIISSAEERFSKVEDTIRNEFC